MSTPDAPNHELLSALDKLFAKYFKQEDHAPRSRNPAGAFWGAYLEGARDGDEARSKDWDGNTGSILTFTGLFAATVAAFVIESKKLLQPDSGDQTVDLLARVLAATTNASALPSSVEASSETFRAPTSAVIANALWFCSLIVVLACALLATLVQQWSRDYVRDIKQRDTLDENIETRALNHAYVRMGVDRYGMDMAVYVIVSLVHLAVALFTAGLIIYLFTLNPIVAWCTLSVLGIFGIAYLAVSIIPIYDHGCPYRSPLTHTLAIVHWLCVRALQRCAALCIYIVRFVIGKLLDRWSVGMRWRDNLALRSTQIIHNKAMYPASRRPQLEHSSEFWTGMSSSILRFGYIWMHISRQLLGDSQDSNALKILLQGTFGLLESMPDGHTRSECIRRISRDEAFTGRLYDSHVVRGQLGHSDPDTRAASLKMLCLLMQEAYTTDDTLWTTNRVLGIDTSNPTLITGHHLTSLFFLIGHSQNTHGSDTAFAQSARMYLFHLRWSLLLIARERMSNGLLKISTTKCQPFFAPALSGNPDAEHRDWWPLLVQDNCKALQPPWGLLLLLNSSQYNAIDAPELRANGRDWRMDTSSCLVPLHDGACCRSRNGPLTHIAACTMLTMISHLIRIDADPEELLEDLVSKYGKLWPQRDSLAQLVSEINSTGGNLAPSPEFVDILRHAGLYSSLASGTVEPVTGAWQRAPSPPLELSIDGKAKSDYVNRRLGHRIAPGSMLTLKDALRALARQVDVLALREFARMSDHLDLSANEHLGAEGHASVLSGPAFISDVNPSDSTTGFLLARFRGARPPSYKDASRDPGSAELKEVVIPDARRAPFTASTGRGMSKGRLGGNIASGSKTPMNEAINEQASSGDNRAYEEVVRDGGSGNTGEERRSEVEVREATEMVASVREDHSQQHESAGETVSRLDKGKGKEVA